MVALPALAVVALQAHAGRQRFERDRAGELWRQPIPDLVFMDVLLARPTENGSVVGSVPG